MVEIDSLEIKISSDAVKANNAINNLVKNLGRLATSLKIDTSGLEKIGKSLNFSGIDKSAESMQSQMQKVSKSLSQITEQYKDLGKGFEIKGSTSQIQKQIDSLTNQLAKAKLAKEDFEASGKTNLGGYETAVKNVIKYENQIESLKNQLKSMNEVKIQPDFGNTEELIERMKTQIQQSMSGMRIENPIDLASLSEENFSFFMRLKEEMSQTAASAKQMGEQIKESVSSVGFQSYDSGKIQQFIDDYASASVKINDANSKIKETGKSLKEVGEAAKNANELKDVGKIADTASDSFSKLSKNSLKASNSLKKMQSSLKSMLSALLPILGIRELVRFGKESIKSSMDYLEILNYFDAAFGQVAANTDLSAFEEMGYDSAEAYYNSFAKRAEQLTAKMSGFTIGEGGLLESTGTVSLGLDPSQLMNYQAMFGQMASSMGAASETSLKLSQALTKIGADLASVKNMDFEDVWNDMASGLAGMSRTLDKYGVNIRNVNLQQKLTELGINANINALNQNDKALLRTIILLDSTKYAWGDLADTINQPANQLRLIQANFQNLARTIGNLFLPIVKTVLPYINALVIAVQRLFAWLGNLIGIDIKGISTSIGSTDISGFLDQTDDLSDSLGNVADNAKKAKAGLRAFDELKVINMPEETKGGAGIGGIAGGLLDEAFNKSFEEYQKAWDEAFGKLENRAQELADKIENAFEPVKKIIEDFAVGDFFQAGQDVSNLVVSITDFFARAIDNVDWYGIGQKMGDFLAGIDWIKIFVSVGHFLWEGLKVAVELGIGTFDSAPIETVFLAILTLPSIVGFGSKLISVVINPFKNILELLLPIISGIGGAISSLSAPVLILTSAFSALVAGLGYVLVTNEEVRDSFSQALSTIQEGLQPALEFLTETLLPDLQSGWERILEILEPLGTFLEGMFTNIWQDMINPALTYIGETVLPMLTNAFENLWNNVLVPLGSFLADVLEPVIKIISDVLKMLWENVVVPLADAIGNVLSEAFEGLCDIFNNTVVPIVSTVIEVFQFLWDKVFAPIIDFLWDIFKPAFDEVFKGIKGIIEGLKKTFSGLISFVTGAFTGDWRRAWNGVKTIFSGIWKTLSSIIKAPINGVIAIFEGLANKVIDAWNWIKSSINSVSIDVPSWLGGGTIGFNLTMSDHINIPRLATGGIAYKATYAEIGEAGKEGILPLTNKSAMSQLVNEIMMSAGTGELYNQGTGGDYLRQVEEATYRGTIRAIQAAGGIKADITFDVKGDPNRLFEVMQKQAKNYTARTHRPAFDF